MINGDFLNSQQWYTAEDPATQLLPSLQRDWLFYPDSLTAALKQQSTHFVVQPLQEYWSTTVYSRERDLLPTDQQYWIREVLLQGDGQNWIFARSVIPQQLCLDLGVLTQMGCRPLGEFLFANQVRRSAFEWCQTIYGLTRHSVFYLGRLGLLVNECFLPHFFQQISTSPYSQKA